MNANMNPTDVSKTRFVLIETLLSTKTIPSVHVNQGSLDKVISVAVVAVTISIVCVEESDAAVSIQ